MTSNKPDTQYALFVLMVQADQLRTSLARLQTELGGTRAALEKAQF